MREHTNDKDKLRLGFADTFEGAKTYFTKILSERYEVIRDDQDPEYLIFGDRNFGESNIHYKDCVRIFYTGENQRHTDYRCDYAVTFDHPTSERMFRLPLYLMYENDHNILRDREVRDVNDYDNKGFCSFVVRNPNCHYRNAYIHTLSQYNAVASAGPLFNNMNGWNPKDVIEKVKFMSGYRFNLCFENSSYPGYCTEKLFEALCAKTIPIYWGSSTAALDFNPKAFLSRHNYSSDVHFISEIFRLHNDKDAYNEMYLQPMFREDEFNRNFNHNHFLDWFQSVVYKGSVDV